MRIAGESESVTDWPSSHARRAAEDVNDASGRVNLNTAKNVKRKRGVDQSVRKSTSPSRGFDTVHSKGLRTVNNLLNESSGVVPSDA